MPATITTPALFAKLRDQAGKIAELELVIEAQSTEMQRLEALVEQLTPAPDAEPPTPGEGES